MTKASADDLQAALAALALLDRAALAERWVAAFGCPAPRKCGATLLRSAVAWQLQMQTQSGARPGIHQPLRSLQRPASARRASPLSPGTRLLREWQHRTHHVTVLPAGFEYEGKRYRSLTAIARHITGTAWSGPLFFGLRQ